MAGSGVLLVQHQHKKPCRTPTTPCDGLKNSVKDATLMFKLTIVTNSTNCCQFSDVTPSAPLAQKTFMFGN
jgi:hypothetical protein